MATTPNPDYPTFCSRCHTDLTLYSDLTGCPVCARLAAELPSIIAQIREQAGLHAIDEPSQAQPQPQPTASQPLPRGEYDPSPELRDLRRTGLVSHDDTYRLHGLGVRW